MKYPADFIAAVKEAFPDWTELHKALEAGGEIVGRFLLDSSYWTPDPQEVADMIDQGRVSEVRAEAQEHITADKLHDWWLQLMEHKDAC